MEKRTNQTKAEVSSTKTNEDEEQRRDSLNVLSILAQISAGTDATKLWAISAGVSPLAFWKDAKPAAPDEPGLEIPAACIDGELEFPFAGELFLSGPPPPPPFWTPGARGPCICCCC